MAKDKTRKELAWLLRMQRKHARNASRRGDEAAARREINAILILQELADRLGYHPDTPELLRGVYKGETKGTRSA
ncbi:MAG: hypothetical protein ACE5JO_05770 [Candidatus Binatia bacterium]